MAWVHRVADLVAAHPFATGALAIGSFAGSVIVTIVVLVRLPADYFVGATPRPWFAARPPAVRLVLNVARTIAGLALIVLGVLMSVPGVPGQGILTIVLGVMLAEVPGKRRLERWLVARPFIRRAIDRLRARYQREPIRTE